MTPGYPDPSSLAVARSASRLFGTPRFDGYLVHCRGDRHAALRLYQWNAAASAAAWETLGHLEIAVRNAMADVLESRHRRHGRHGSWLDDPANELGFNARRDIAKARARVSTKRKPASDGQTMAELGFGFWRFLLARRHQTTLWPDLARAFGHAPDRRLATVEAPVVRLHEFRNRLAHHERVWTQPLTALHTDMLDLLHYIDPDLARWVADRSRLPHELTTCPQSRPYP